MHEVPLLGLCKSYAVGPQVIYRIPFAEEGITKDGQRTDGLGNVCAHSVSM